MSNQEISKLFATIAVAYTLKDEQKYRFQIIAYKRASETIAQIPTELEDLFREKSLAKLPGIGPAMKEHLEELFTTGKVTHFEELLKNIPQSIFPLLEVPGFGPKKAYALVTAFHLTNPKTVIPDIEKLAKSGKIAKIEGFGKTSEQDILQSLQQYHTGSIKTNRMTLVFANELANTIIAYLQKSPDVINAYPLGSLRRKKETIGDIDIAVTTNNSGKVIKHFISYPNIQRIIEQGEKTASILVGGGKQIDLMTQSVAGFGSLLQHFTGSKEHNVALREYALSLGLSLSEYGIKKKNNEEKITQYETEESFYHALGLQWIPPEIRENTGEIALAKKNKLPKLVTKDDITGDFHVHSNYPLEPSHDLGASSMDEMIQKAKSLGYTMIGFSEHNPSVSKHSSEQIKKIIIKRKKYIDQLNKKYNKSIRVFSLLEVDITPTGELAVENETLSLLDAAIVSIHSSFHQNKKTMTERIIKGLSHKKAKIFAHPTGRLLNERPGYDVDWDMLFAFCKEHHKALEINSYPSRLDLSDVLVRKAIQQEVKLIINTDSHHVDQMDLIEYGVSVARRGWATKHDILNTMPYNKIEEWFSL